MVEQELIERFKNILSALENKRGKVSFFALLKMDDITDKWTVLLSAPWVNDSDREEIFFELRTLILENIDKSELSLIARFGIFNKREHLIELLLDNFSSGEYISQDHQVNGNVIHEGYILASNKNLG